ncbi:hypothetical protein EW026_g81 [Hermanssonia centrifuga]|uniref:Helicase C-terminal domain-containing protein n=1 Tax=Hermanssonia centrifuga TaxID=98765 RepID=A0A4S4KVL1_9APHY|nr:hypothetical protein EW026_g81 [Hermanssonia centrifuga]
MGEIRRLQELLVEHTIFASEEHFKIYPLHSTIASDQQAAVFDIPPPGIRKIVIATNIAETGITIPDITCVIDTGRHREMRFDEKRQLSRLLETFVAKSNAAQRRGRAGRVQRGLCFHLFTKIRYDRKMAEHPDPEMLRLSLSDLALRIKIMKVSLGSSIEDTLSRALDPPSSVNIQRAVAALVENLQQIEELRQQFLGYLVDSSFIQIDQAVVRDLNRARYSRNRNRFITIPPELDRNSSNSALIHAAISAGLYPKLLSIEQTKDGKDRLVTVTNNQSVSFHPSSVNFGRRPRDFGVNYLSYFTIMQSKKMYAWETGPADDISLLLLCGEAEFKVRA